ncbi:hypothetical protein ES703_92657 [subsurface metagenome]
MGRGSARACACPCARRKAATDSHYLPQREKRPGRRDFWKEKLRQHRPHHQQKNHPQRNPQRPSQRFLRKNRPNGPRQSSKRLKFSDPRSQPLPQKQGKVARQAEQEQDHIQCSICRASAQGTRTQWPSRGDRGKRHGHGRARFSRMEVCILYMAYNLMQWLLQDC